MDNGRLDELFDRYLDRDLSAAEESELAALLARPECQEQWRRLSALEGKIQEEFLDPSSGEAPARTSRRSLKTGTRRAQARQFPTYGFMSLAAAAILAVAIWFFWSGPPSEQTGKADARRKATAAAEAEATRKDREARLQEIERKRKELEAVTAPRAEKPDLKSKREKELQDLRKQKEQKERELREAIELAKKSAPPPPPPPPAPQEKPAVPPEPPKQPQESKPTETMLATLERVEGSVSIVGKEGNAPAQKGQGIFPGQGVETGVKSFVAIKYLDGTLLEIGEETVAREMKTDGGKRVRLEKGIVKARVAKQPKDQPMIFSTPQGEAKVLGTTLRLAVDPDPKKATKLEVEEGRVELKNLTGKSVLVESGHYAVAVAGSELVPKKRLEDPEFLVAHWTFDETAGTSVADVSGRFIGTLMNGAARGPGRFGNALAFDGADDYVEFASHPNLEGMSEITLSAWILLSKLPGPSRFSLPVSKEPAYNFSVDQGGGVAFAVGTENNPLWSAETVSGSAALPLKTWCHVAGTYDGTHVRVYRNGVVGETHGPVSGPIVKSGLPLTLTKTLPDKVPFEGGLDDLRIYKRALTAAEIQILASGRRPK